jgi:hypothetical protein
MPREREATKTERDLRAILAGIQKTLPPGKTMAFRQGTIDGAALEALVTQALAPHQAVHEDNAALARDLAERRARAPEAKQLIKDVKDAALVAFGELSDPFQELGFEPRKKPAPLTPEARQLQIERLRATRLARHTLGPRARKAVKGTSLSQAPVRGALPYPPPRPSPAVAGEGD